MVEYNLAKVGVGEFESPSPLQIFKGKNMKTYIVKIKADEKYKVDTQYLIGASIAHMGKIKVRKSFIQWLKELFS